MDWIDKIIYNTLITYNSVRVNFINGNYKLGFFEANKNFDQLKSDGKLRFIENSGESVILEVKDIVEVVIL
ncbi:hypothetical protein SAMN05428642_101370 [Flaviramulus basaltis]|uniref:Uncharacterized protein n=1 Tax=Flaviramulus basaltis TaxID=369401 RepID=A0A1K2IAV1_9FLAO|nr:hypothetical protein [Flaviramulus basaltis]SFZ89533.1 hypothetical protein SAMN05428642_101370 [Flaviramulus basaltis]